MPKNCPKLNYHHEATAGWALAGWMLKAIVVAVVLLCGAAARAQTLQPTFWKQRVFYIPYQLNQQSKLLNPIAKVQLLYSPTGANDWATLQEAKPNVQGFSYHAPEDGEYWFALRHLDRQGKPWPNADVQPQMRIVIDTEQPVITLSGSANVRGEVAIRYEAQDANLQPESLLVEVRSSNKQWSPIRPATADISQPDRLVGRVPWQPPAGVDRVELRASITDKAGHRQQATTTIDLRSPVVEAGPAFPGESKDPFMANKQRLPSQDWPSSNRLPQRSVANNQVPPIHNPYVLDSRTPAWLVGDRAGQMQSLSVQPLDENNAPQLTDNSNSAWTPAEAGGSAATTMVNSRTFDLEYDLQSVGPWGVSKVELWGTQDSGRSWQSYGVDPDNRSPIRASVPGAGVYGFRILVDGANSAGSPPPQAGDEPELTVAVDLQPPSGELLATELGRGNLADHLLIRWSAADTNLEPRPIALFYSSYPNGPWSTIAAGLENTGSFNWRIERHVPGRFYLRLEVRDTAGNLATYQGASPVELARPNPQGKLRGVRAVGDAARN